MKKQIVPAILLLAMAVLIAVGSQTFLAPCIHEDGSFGSCHWAGQALLGLGLAVGVLAVLALCVRHARFGIFLSVLPVCILGILTPGTLIDLCHMPAMRCRMVTQPAIVLLFSAAFLCALIGAILNARKS